MRHWAFIFGAVLVFSAPLGMYAHAQPSQDPIVIDENGTIHLNGEVRINGNAIVAKPDGTVSIGNGRIVVDKEGGILLGTKQISVTKDGTLTLQNNGSAIKLSSDGSLAFTAADGRKAMTVDPKGNVRMFDPGGTEFFYLGDNGTAPPIINMGALHVWRNGTVAITGESGKHYFYVWPDSGEVTLKNLPVSVASESLRLVRGTVGKDGAVLDGAGFTVSKGGGGRPGNCGSGGVYTVKFSSPFSKSPSASATQHAVSNVASTIDNALVTDVQKGEMKVFTGAGNGCADNRKFSFIAVGPK